MKVCIIAFNMGNSNGFVNGPGMSLLNFVKFLKRYHNCHISVHTQLHCSESLKEINIGNIKNIAKVKRDILGSDIIHFWSGLTDKIYKIMTFAKSNKKKIFFGPNLIDNVNKELERKIINQINPNKLFVVNNKIKTKSLELYGLLDSDVKEVIVGPDTDIWKPPSDYSNNILWKGNSNHVVKDVGLALDISKRLDKYNFTFFGYPKPYSYAEHIDIARKSYLYFTTSISETKGMAVLEQFAAGVPCITHKNIFQAGISYKTGIIVKRDIDSYCSAIEEIMEDSDLRCKMSKFAVNYVKDLYNPSKLIKNVVKYYKE